MPAQAQIREHSSAAQPVPHPVERLAFLEVAGPPAVVATAPAPHPGVLTDPFLELEPVERSVPEYLIVRHHPIVARGCDARTEAAITGGIGTPLPLTFMAWEGVVKFR
jgi:hypothetical protein